MFDLDKEEFLISRDVVFYENELPYITGLKDSLENRSNVSPAVELLDDDWELVQVTSSNDRGSITPATENSEAPTTVSTQVSTSADTTNLVDDLVDTVDHSETDPATDPLVTEELMEPLTEPITPTPTSPEQLG